MCTSKRIVLSLIFLSSTFWSEAQATRRSRSLPIINNLSKSNLLLNYGYKTPDKDRSNISNIAVHYLRTKNVLSTDTVEEKDLRFESNRDVFVSQLASINLPEHSNIFLKNQLPLEDRFLIKRGGSHLQAQTNRLSISLPEEQFILELNSESEDITNKVYERSKQNNCKHLEKILVNKKQSKAQKTLFILESSEATANNSKLSRSFSGGDLLNLTAHKKRNFQLSYMGQSQNTTFYSRSKNTSELFFNLLELINLDICNWSINSESDF